MPELLTALDAFLQEHRRCGELDGGVDGERVDGVRLRGWHRAPVQKSRALDCSRHSTSAVTPPGFS
jgi:hypothetical protein